MKEYFVGDRIRLLHQQGEGVVVRLIDEKTIEVAIDNDFSIPVLRTDVVLINAGEKKLLRQEGAKPASQAATAAAARVPLATGAKGVFMGAVPGAGGLATFFLINNTGMQLVYTLQGASRSTKVAREQKGLKHGVVESYGHQEIFRHNMQYLAEWPILHLNILFFGENTHIAPDPLLRVFDLKDRHFKRELQALPQMGKEGFLFQLDGTQGPADVQRPQPVAVAVDGPSHAPGAAFGIPAGAPAAPLISITRPSTVVDLHFEKLEPHADGWTPEAMLAVQLSAFEKALDQAVASNFEKITFIHGVGAGVLRERMHKALGRHKSVQTFKDAQKEKFGYGATEVLLK